MQSRRTTDTSDDYDPRPPSSPSQSSGDVPLVIVSERGRHSNESRRIVRAQAARASAAQSRVTRARNREERAGTGREPLSSPTPRYPPETPFAESPFRTSPPESPRRSLLAWVSEITRGPTAEPVTNVSSATTSPGGRVVSSSSADFRTSAGFPLFQPTTETANGLRLQLPLAVQRGFTALQQQVTISDHFMLLLRRTSCFDFDSPGLTGRLHQLLSDLVERTPTEACLMGHPIQGHLRIACICVTIFQGQRLGGAVIAEGLHGRAGLDAAWSEAVSLDQSALREPKALEAALWAVFMINVTTGAPADTFRDTTHFLLDELRLDRWDRVRSTLLEFIYPVSLLDESCRRFYDTLYSLGHA